MAHLKYVVHPASLGRVGRRSATHRKAKAVGGLRCLTHPTKWQATCRMHHMRRRSTDVRSPRAVEEVREGVQPDRAITIMITRPLNRCPDILAILAATVGGPQSKMPRCLSPSGQVVPWQPRLRWFRRYSPQSQGWVGCNPGGQVSAHLRESMPWRRTGTEVRPLILSPSVTHRFCREPHRVSDRPLTRVGNLERSTTGLLPDSSLKYRVCLRKHAQECVPLQRGHDLLNCLLS